MATNLPSYETAVDLATRKKRDPWRTESMLTPEMLAEQEKEAAFNRENRRLQGEAEAATPALVNREREAAARAGGEPFYEGYVEPFTGRASQPVYLKAPAPPLPAPVQTLEKKVLPPSAAAVPSKPPMGNAAQGPETALTERAGGNVPPARGGGQDYHDRVKAVRMPSGKIVFTNVPAALQDKGGAQVDYGTAMEETTGRPYRGGVNVYEGPAGTVFSQPGQEVATAAAMGEMGPPAPLEASLPELTDPVAIWERQQWLEGRGAMERATRQEEAKTTAAEAAAEAATARAAVDPLAAAQIEAEGRYGGEMIQQEGRASETNLALRVIAEITDRQNKLRATMPPGPDRDALVNQLEQDKKLYLVAIRPQAAAGLMRPDPFAAFGMPTPAPPTETSPPKKQ